MPSNKLWFARWLLLQSGTEYSLASSGTWKEARISCPPSGYDIKKELPEWLWPVGAVRALRPLNSGDIWFQLLGKGADDVFVFSKSRDYAPKLDGQLFCAANDCPVRYWNNSDALTLQVTP